MRDCTNCGCVYSTSEVHLCPTAKTNPNDLVMGTLTKREYFSALILQGLMSRSSGPIIPREVIQIADMLIEELNK